MFPKGRLTPSTVLLAQAMAVGPQVWLLDADIPAVRLSARILALDGVQGAHICFDDTWEGARARSPST